MGTHYSIATITDLACLSNNECNRCRISGSTHEQCSGTKPVCDMDSSTSGTQTSATRKLAVCVACTGYSACSPVSSCGSGCTRGCSQGTCGSGSCNSDGSCT